MNTPRPCSWPPAVSEHAVPAGGVSTARSTPSRDIGRLHAQQFDDTKQTGVSAVSTPHNGRHTVAYRLSKESGTTAPNLNAGLGHRQRAVPKLYTNPPEAEAARLVEGL